MAEATPEQLRTATDHLANAASPNYHAPTAAVSAAYYALPEGDRRRDMLGTLYRLVRDSASRCVWIDLVQAARLRLLVEAWAQTRDKFYEPHIPALELLEGWLEEAKNG